MSEERRDVAERLAEYERLKLDYAESVIAVEQPDLLDAEYDDACKWTANAERALDAFVGRLLRNEGREPDAWYIEEPGAGMIPWFTRDATAAEQYRAKRYKVRPVYFGTPSDSPAGEG